MFWSVSACEAGTHTNTVRVSQGHTELTWKLVKKVAQAAVVGKKSQLTASLRTQIKEGAGSPEQSPGMIVLNSLSALTASVVVCRFTKAGAAAASRLGWASARADAAVASASNPTAVLIFAACWCVRSRLVRLARVDQKKKSRLCNAMHGPRRRVSTSGYGSSMLRVRERRASEG